MPLRCVPIPMSFIFISISSEASPQTDEACGGCGSDRRLHVELW